MPANASTTSSATATSTPTAIPAATETPTALEPRAFHAAYKRYIDQALALGATELEPFHGDVVLMLRNVRIGVRSVIPRLEQIRSELPSVRSEAITELESLTEALYHSTRLITEPVTPHEISERFQRVSPLRKEMLRAAEAFARRGLVPADRVERIRRGAGRIDSASDAMDLAALYIDHQAAIAGKHPFTPEEIAGLADDGAWLVRALTKEGARKEQAVQLGVSPRDIRDRLYTLVTRDHKILRRVGSYLWDGEVDLYVPKMGSRVAAPRGSSTSGEVTPVTSTPSTGSTPSA